jgi:hypothetical protein
MKIINFDFKQTSYTAFTCFHLTLKIRGLILEELRAIRHAVYEDMDEARQF